MQRARAIAVPGPWREHCLSSRQGTGNAIPTALAPLGFGARETDSAPPARPKAFREGGVRCVRERCEGLQRCGRISDR